MFTTEPELAAYLDQREEAKHSRLLLNPSFTAAVTGVKGAAGAYLVQIQRAGDSGNDETWYEVENNGTVPTIGARVSLRWRDQNLATAVSVVGTPPLVADQHNIKARIYWTGSATLAAGVSHIPYTAATANGDPSGMFVNGDIKITIPGWYLVIVKTGITGTTSIAAMIYRNSVQAVIGTWADNAGGQSEAIAVDLMHCNAGDFVQGYIYNVSAGATFLSDGAANYLSIHLFSAD